MKKKKRILIILIHFLLRFYGLHTLRIKTKSFIEKKYFVIMENIFNTPNEVHTRYDIKGSRYKRRLNDE